MGAQTRAGRKIMGFDFGALKNTLRGSGKETLPIELAAGETERTRVVASRNPGGLGSAGGDLVLTSQRLIFTPLNVKDIGKLLAYGLSKAGASELVAGIPEKLVKAVGEATVIGPGTLSSISSVDAGSGPSLLKPPTIIVTTADGSRTEIGILAARMAMNRSNENTIARNGFLAQLRQALDKR
jgi:hypothetical protein